MPNRIDFYMDSHGKNSVLEYLAELANRRDKQSRVKHEKIAQQLDYLSQFGLAVLRSLGRIHGTAASACHLLKKSA